MCDSGAGACRLVDAVPRGCSSFALSCKELPPLLSCLCSSKHICAGKNGSRPQSGAHEQRLFLGTGVPCSTASPRPFESLRARPHVRGYIEANYVQRPRAKGGTVGQTQAQDVMYDVTGALREAGEEGGKGDGPERVTKGRPRECPRACIYCVLTRGATVKRWLSGAGLSWAQVIKAAITTTTPIPSPLDFILTSFPLPFLFILSQRNIVDDVRRRQRRLIRL